MGSTRVDPAPTEPAVSASNQRRRFHLWKIKEANIRKMEETHSRLVFCYRLFPSEKAHHQILRRFHRHYTCLFVDLQTNHGKSKQIRHTQKFKFQPLSLHENVNLVTERGCFRSIIVLRGSASVF
jgi:hypothetical protein